MAVSKRLRFEILRRDNHACKYCGRTPPEITLTVDHVVPVALGGSDEPGNLVAACEDCNGGKSSVPAGAPLIDDVAQSALRWSAAMQLVAEERKTAAEERRELHSWFNWVWITAAEDYRLINQWHPDGPDVPPDWIDTVAKFLAAGLSQEDIQRLTRVAMRSRVGSAGKWKYFCGCCWTEIRKMQQRAMEILAEQEGAK